MPSKIDRWWSVGGFKEGKRRQVGIKTEPEIDVERRFSTSNSFPETEAMNDYDGSGDLKNKHKSMNYQVKFCQNWKPKMDCLLASFVVDFGGLGKQVGWKSNENRTKIDSKFGFSKKNLQTHGFKSTFG